MQKLIAGLHYFQHSVFGTQRELFERLVGGQLPLACFITCSDARVNPNLITNTDPGDLFLVRNAGNLVPPLDAGLSGEAAAVEFAVCGLGVQDVIVCGHTHCGAMRGLMQPETLAPTPLMRDWLRHAGATRRIIAENYGHLHGDALVTAAAEENVLVQLEHLRTWPLIATRLAEGTIRLHAWMYKIETGQVFEYDAERQQYVPVTEHLTSPVDDGSLRRALGPQRHG